MLPVRRCKGRTVSLGLLDRFYATANHDSLVGELYLIRWLDDMISDRNLSEFGYWPDLVSLYIHPNFIDLTETPPFSPLTVKSTDSTPTFNLLNISSTGSSPPFSPLSDDLTNSTPPVSYTFINLTKSPPSPDNRIIVVCRHLTNTDDNTSTSLPFLNDNDIFNALIWLKHYNTMRNAYSSPWVMQHVERPGYRSRLCSRSGVVKEEL